VRDGVAAGEARLSCADAGRPQPELTLPLDELRPAADAVLAAQGMPACDVPPRVAALLDAAQERFAALARPRGLYRRTSHEAFAAIFPGEGDNDSDAPLAAIFPRAASLALYAATLGEPLCAAIRGAFDDGDPALGLMLDTVASLAADAASELLARRFAAELDDELAVLPYSPGYCGWHVSGQHALFAELAPVELGITLNPSALMQPLKSVSGVLVAGPPAIHVFKNDFAFCASCATEECRSRIARLARS